MAYLQTSDFKLGMDRTRERYTGLPGALWTLKNGHITRGGDVEGMKKFVPVYTLPAGTLGLAANRGQLTVFGSADLAGSMPPGVSYQRLTSGAAFMTQIHDVRSFDGKLYVIAEFDDGAIGPYYDGTYVNDWRSISDQNTSNIALAAYMADFLNTRADVQATAYGPAISVVAAQAGTPFDISASYQNGGSNNDQSVVVATQRANVPAVDEVRASFTVSVTGGTEDPGVNVISGLTVGSTSLMMGAVDWISSNESTALDVQQAINNQTSAHGYSAVANGAVVTVRAATGTGAAPNGQVVVVALTGNVTVAASATVAGGVSEVDPIAQISTVTLGGTFEAPDALFVVINSKQYGARAFSAGMGLSAFVWKKKIWSPANSLYAYSAVDDPTVWAADSTGAGGGFINMANQSEGSERLIASAEYNGNVAIFARQTIRIWTLDADPAKNAAVQTLDNTGTLAPRSVLKYGNQDVFYLSDSGIRSLRARDASNAAVADDVGTRIDAFIQSHFAALTPAVQGAACAVIEPIDGRYFLAMGERVYVFSYFPALKVSAWSYYEPGISFSDFARSGRRLYARSGDTIYAYGGLDGNTYPDEDETPTVLETPFLAAGTPATWKALTGFDMACVGDWYVTQLVDPNDETKSTTIGRIPHTTYNIGRIPAVGQAGVFALDMTCGSAGRRVLSAVADHFQTGDAG